MPQNATPPAADQTKTKQERIRDNQRRSRARRQEYLSDLEKRLSECQLTCKPPNPHGDGHGLDLTHLVLFSQFRIF